jgi:hypothetical protein
MTGSFDDRDSDGPRPAWVPVEHLPEDARRIGLNRSVPDGALLDFAGNLDSSKRLHRITAWVMLAVFGLPVAFYVLRLMLDVLPG